MTCERAQQQLLLYLADELSAPEREEVRRHLGECEACYTLAVQWADTEAQLHSALQQEPAVPSSLDERVMNVVRSLPAPRGVRQRPAFWLRLRPGFAWAAAAAAVAISFGAGRTSTRVQPPAPGAGVDLLSLGDTHVRLAATKPKELSAQDPARMSSELSARLRFPVRPVDLRPEDTRLVGGTEVAVDGGTAACLHYDWHGSRISLFQMDAGRLSPAGLALASSPRERYVAERKNGVSVVAWRSGTVNCVLVAREMPMHRLFQLACHACERQEASSSDRGA